LAGGDLFDLLGILFVPFVQLLLLGLMLFLQFCRFGLVVLRDLRSFSRGTDLRFVLMSQE
jgi:hypothetical protein